MCTMSSARALKVRMIAKCAAIELTNETELPRKKAYDVDYKVRSLQEIVDMQTTAVANIRTLLEVSVSSLKCLSYCRSTG